jgi:hypothetical protein
MTHEVWTMVERLRVEVAELRSLVEEHGSRSA